MVRTTMNYKWKDVRDSHTMFICYECLRCGLQVKNRVESLHKHCMNKPLPNPKLLYSQSQVEQLKRELKKDFGKVYSGSDELLTIFRTIDYFFNKFNSQSSEDTNSNSVKTVQKTSNTVLEGQSSQDISVEDELSLNGKESSQVLLYCIDCYQMTNHDEFGNCLKCISRKKVEL